MTLSRKNDLRVYFLRVKIKMDQYGLDLWGKDLKISV